MTVFVLFFLFGVFIMGGVLFIVWITNRIVQRVIKDADTFHHFITEWKESGEEER